MDWLWLSFVYGVALAMDCLALSITDGLVYQDLNQKKWRPFFIAGVFALGQSIFPLAGFLLGETVSSYIDKFDHYIAFVLLAFIGGKMLYEGIKGMVHPGEAEPKQFTVKEVLFQGVADSIDALAVGITLPTNIHTATGYGNYRTYIAIAIIGLCTFIISLIGLFAGKNIAKLFKGKYEVSEVIGGSVLIILGIVIMVEGIMSSL
jgi:manganese efflux pump family protein